jgi:outer membrane lipoprotein SlyB
MTISTATPLKSSHLLAWITGSAVILFCLAGIAALMGWIPDSVGGVIERPQVFGTGKATLKVTPPAAAMASAVPLNPSVSVPVVAVCTRCGVIVSMRNIVTNGEGSGLGVAGGAVVGGLLGRQLGGGRGRDLATVVGAVGGAVAGNAVEKRARTTQSREITVLLDDGATRVIRVADDMDWDAGDHVKIVGGVLQRN